MANINPSKAVGKWLEASDAAAKLRILADLLDSGGEVELPIELVPNSKLCIVGTEIRFADEA